MTSAKIHYFPKFLPDHASCLLRSDDNTDQQPYFDSSLYKQCCKGEFLLRRMCSLHGYVKSFRVRFSDQYKAIGHLLLASFFNGV